MFRPDYNEFYHARNGQSQNNAGQGSGQHGYDGGQSQLSDQARQAAQARALAEARAAQAAQAWLAEARQARGRSGPRR